MVLSGDRNLTNNAGAGATPVNTPLPAGGICARMGTNQTATVGAGYTKDTHQGTGNAALGDGSVQPETVSRLRDQFKNSDNNDNILGIGD
jgi:prepilin-type processing-associated H-X9-DG protein